MWIDGTLATRLLAVEMKPHHAILLGFAIGLVLGALAIIYFREPCPSTATSTTTQGMLDLRDNGRVYAPPLWVAYTHG